MRLSHLGLALTMVIHGAAGLGGIESSVLY